MAVISFETADTDDWTAIGEGLVRPAREAGRLLVRPAGGDGPKYALDHGDGCGTCGDPVRAGGSFFLDTDAGELLCETHGRERREQKG
jgi:hypothetical protein